MPLVAAVACGPTPEEERPPVAPTSKPRPPDRTEVSMEVTPIETAAPPGTTPPASAVSTTGNGEPADDPSLGGKQAEASAEKAVAAMRPRIRVCYKKALNTETSVDGIATFDVSVKDGKVTASRFVKREGLPEEMVGCLMTVVKAMTFDGDERSHVVSLTFGHPPTAAALAADAGPKK